ncbi:MAG: RHS repeat-associated core domain-containing protein [Sphingobacteriales bacterium]
MKKVNRLMALISLLVLAACLQGFAGTKPFTRALHGSLKVGDTISVRSTGVTGTDKIKDLISFRLADQKLVSKDFSCALTLRLEYWKTFAQASPDTAAIQLKINYNTKAGATYKLKDIYQFTGAVKLKVTIKKIDCPELGEQLPAAFELSAGINVDHKYVFSQKKVSAFHARVLVHRSVVIAPKKKLFLGLFSLFGSGVRNSSGLIDTGKQLQLFWGNDTTANEYDVEWTTTDDGNKYKDTIARMWTDTPYVASASVLNNIFLHNATRITTADTSYLLSLCYNDDYILVRIRSIQYTSAGIRLLGPWGYTLASGRCALWKLNWYESNLNWQYSAAFAEEGKKKEVASYFDGTLRGRQTVTINNSDNVAVVQENVYDAFGRATASILPAPQHNPVDSLPSLHYFQNQNQNSLNSVYSASNVTGLGPDSCEFRPDTLNSISGAAMYYSHRNLFLYDTGSPNFKRYNFYIPDAGGYPLSVTQYTGDNTGRIKYQGGVGKVFQPGNDTTQNKITKYYYGKPEQWELDQLFGNDVGYASHYLKNMVVDPNGQVSISYINASGKTIATALTGAPPASMDSLKTIVPDTTVTVSLLDSSKFVYNNTGMVLSATTTYLSPLANDSAVMRYSIRKLISRFPADSLNICSNCYYNLTVKVSNDCGDIVYANTSPIKIGSDTANCGTTGTVMDSIKMRLVNIGEYYITFSFAFDKTVMDRYADSVVSKGQVKGAIKNEIDFILPYLDSLDFKTCLSDCTTCLQTLGSQANFINMVRTKLVALDVDTVGSSGAINTWATNEYTVLKAYCDSLHAHCDSSVYASPCQRYMQPMLDDVSPGGQYALFDTQNNALDTTENVIYQNWRSVFPIKSSTDSTYQANLITLPDGSITSPYDANFNYHLVVQYWQTGWAQLFLPYHPEYCKLLFCQQNENYELWDQTVQDSIILASQIPHIPNAPSGFHYDYTNGAWLVAADPFFQSGAPGAGMATDFTNDLQNYTLNAAKVTALSTKDLVKFVDFLVYCAAPGTTTNTLNNTLNNWDSCSPDPTCRVPDREWALYKDFYFALKEQYYTRLRLKTTCANKCTVGTPESLPTNSACPSVSDFALADYSSGDGAPADTCDSTKKLVTLNYMPGYVAAKVTVTLSYATGTNTTGLPTTVTLDKGDRNYMFCVPATLPAESITVVSAVCDSCQVNPLVFNTWVNDHIIQNTYSGGTVISTRTLHVDSQVYFPGTLSIKPDNTYDVVTSFHPYSGGWELNDSCQFALYSQGVRYLLKNATTDSLALTYRQGNFEETWYYASTGLHVTCTSPDTIHVTALQGTNTYFKGVYPKRHLITVIAGTSGTPPPFTCVNSSGSDTTSTSAFHGCLSVYTPYNTIKYQSVWLFDCVYDNVPSTCPAELLTKESRFPDSFNTPVIGDSATVVSQNRTAVTQQVDGNCEANAHNWMTALDSGLVGHSADTAALKTAFIAICEQGGDIYHPFGASSVAPGQTGPGGYNNFGDAIKGVLHVSSFTLDLNPWLISQPYPYTPELQGNYQTIANTNQPICDLVTKYQHQCDSVNTAHGTHLTLYQYLSQTFGDAMIITSAQLDSLKKSCTSCNFVLDQAVTLPVFLVPGTSGCITPLEYAAADSAFNATFSSPDTTNIHYQSTYANFRNQRWGFALSYDQYKVYEDSLLHNPAKMLCNSIISTAPPVDTLACIESQIAAGVANGKTAFNTYIDSVKLAFEQSYVYTCTNAGEAVTLTTKQKIYHYTLYYYDQADNLIRTIPPEGVALLDAQQISLADRSRNNNPLACTYTGPGTNASKTTAFNALSTTLSRTSAAIEFWLYENGTTQNHFVEITPDKKYLFQLNIAASTLAIDIYPADTSGTKGITFKPASIHYRADITPQIPLDPFTHVVLQGDSLGKANTAQLYLNGVHFTATKVNTTIGPGFTVGSNSGGIIAPDSIQTLKHLRLYSQPLDTTVIWANANNTCFMPTDSSHMTGWYRFNVPAPGGPTTINDSSTVETRLPAVYPTHRLATNYNYNSTNQVSTQNSPDGGTNRFWYDLLSRLVFSQNDKQLPAKNYSYTAYDPIGRIMEVGQKHTTDTLTKPDYLQDTTIAHFYTLGVDSQVTRTYYDEKAFPGGGIQSLPQDNLRKRVALTTYQASELDTVSQATYYDYDIDGNVKNLYQQIAGLGTKRLYNEYDLISGKVNFLGYQNGKNDQFYYQYIYDADNRITQAWASVKADTTSYGFGSKLDPATQKLDASYQYYLHGPLARMELGDVGIKVQGVDYAYTLQGWIKGVNSQYLRPDQDMGQDSATVARDAYAYSLGYYANDYKPIGGSTTYPAFVKQYTQNIGDITGQSLFNGNISTSTLAIDTINSNQPVGYTYHYDQLNRLIHLRQHNGITSWSHTNINATYSEDFSYDGNGNILSLLRSGATATVKDSLLYQYNRDINSHLTNNKLNWLNGIGNATHFGTPQIANNYKYDPIGNMTYDRQDSITNITWSVYGKIQTITDTGKTIAYSYNTAQERVAKTANSLTTYYVRDAQGNTIALYDNASGNINWREQHLYGSSRLGMWLPNINISSGGGLAKWDTIGHKSYELNNHLQNVLATISDARTSTSGYYKPIIQTAQDYYSFGALMPGRNINTENTRYGFNGKENDNEVKGIGNQQDYGMRIYDPRVGRFLSVDPLQTKYAMLTPYQFASNAPIAGVDRDGKEFILSIKEFKMNSPITQMSKKALPIVRAMEIRERGVKDGVVESVSNTYAFFTRDAYKLKTWENFGHLVDEIALSSSGQSYIYNPNTPILDSKVKQLQDVGINGTTYERYKYWTGIAADYATAEISSKGLTGLAKISVLGLRTKLAASFYEKAGIPLEKATQAMDGIDFSKKVKTTTYRKGTVLEQWLKVDKTTNSLIPGNYYTLPETNPNTLGISLVGRDRIFIVLQEDTKFLESTAKTIQDTWTVPGKSLTAEGGGIQLFQTNVKK